MLTDLLVKNASSDRLYVEDVFSAYLYTGTGADLTITTGINLSDKGGIIWTKPRSSGTATGNHWITRWETGGIGYLAGNTNTTTAYSGTASPQTVSSTGFMLPAGQQNQSGFSYASWTFREAPKFFDVVTYTGNGSNRTISHSLGSVPGMIIVKRTDTTGDWQVYHRSLTNTEYAVLNTTAAKATGATRWNSTTATATEFSLGTDSTVNANSGTYVAYLFAHDTTADGIVQCGSYTGNGSSTGPSISLGWEPQYVLIKSSSNALNWHIVDVMRGMTVDQGSALLYPNLSNAEAAATGVSITPTPTGFQVNTASTSVNTNGGTYIYLAIRRGPMRTPTDATKVFSPITATASTGTQRTPNFPVDFMLSSSRNVVGDFKIADRLRGFTNVSNSGQPTLTVNMTSAEQSSNPNAYKFDNTSFLDGAYSSGWSVIWYSLRRAPGFFDVVCYTGTGATLSVSHNLGVVPELVILKRRNGTANWPVWRTALGAGTTFGYLNDSGAEADQGVTLFTSSPTSTAFSVGAWGPINASGGTYVAYLFASCPGVSKFGTYTGNGSSQNINCGFTNGARFVLIKRTDSASGWLVYDTARGINAGNDPYLLLNSTTSEVTTTDYVAPYSAGFAVNSAISVNGGTYIYLAIA